MNKHLILSVITLLIVVGVIAAFWGGMDQATDGSSDEKLAGTTLPTTLPTVTNPGGEGDAGATYKKAIDFYIEHYDELKGDRPDAALAARAVKMVIVAGHKGQVADGFADAYVPMEPGTVPQYKNAPLHLATLTLRYAEKQPEADGKEAMLAVWTFGHRLFANNNRISPRLTGLGMMQNVAITYARQYGENDPKTAAMAEWVAKIDPITRSWDQKMKTIHTLGASVGDLVRIADMDKDKGFRIEALLVMGISQWTTDGSANVRAIHGTLSKYAEGTDRELSQAARAAQAFTRENVRMMH
ncbi:MAG: hypothetical protein GC162_09655 [Planctomycetes bacterium]|nr:hypothetical protein [Planctomycetota bacterium]